MRGESNCKGVVPTAQPARTGRFYRHQIGDRLHGIVLHPVLLRECARLQVARHLSVLRCDKDKAFALRTLLEFEDTQHGLAIGGIAAESIAGLGWIGDKAAAFEVGFEVAGRNGGTSQAHLSYGVTTLDPFVVSLSNHERINTLMSFILRQAQDERSLTCARWRDSRCRAASVARRSGWCRRSRTRAAGRASPCRPVRRRTTRARRW